MKASFAELQSRVIARGLCTACGTCAGVCPDQAVGWSIVDGEPMPELAGECSGCGLCNSVCPGEDVDMPALERFVFGREREKAVPDLGLYREALATWAVDPKTRRRGTGGGLVTALLVYAMESGIIDCALVAGFSQGEPWRAEAKLAIDSAEISAAAQSKYACVPVNTLLGRAVSEGYRRIAVVGLPCHIHALRKIQLAGKPARLARSIVFLAGLYCASQFYLEGTRHLLVEQLGIESFEDIFSMSYRGGNWPGHLAVELKNGQKLTLDRHRYMYHHLMPAFKRDRCEMCVDWSAELADLSAGDYWDPRAQSSENLGMSSCLVRTPVGEEILGGAVQKGYVGTSPVEASRLAAGVGYELKKHAAAFRLKQRQRFGWPAPDYHREVDHAPFARELHLAPETGKDKDG